jgi:glutathionyl-hydroquinone reductase
MIAVIMYCSLLYSQVNNGVYKCGFATSQAAYDKNITPLFDALDRVGLTYAFDMPWSETVIWLSWRKYLSPGDFYVVIN